MAALSIVLTHAAFYSKMLEPGTLVGPFVSRLNCGVTIFFLISGFLLYRPFVKMRMHDEPQLETKSYAWRRFLRITPAYWLALTVTGIWVGLPGVFTATGIPTFYGFAQIYRPETATGGISQAWSLCVELAFYAFLPLWAWLARRVPARTWQARLNVELGGLGLLFLIGFLWKLTHIHYGAVHGVVITPSLLSLPANLDLFAIGMLLATLSVHYENRGRLPAALRPIDRFPVLGWLLALVAFAVIARGVGLTGAYGEPFSKFQYMAEHYLFATIALGLILPAVFGDQQRGVVRRILANRVLMYLGLISYGLYLWHQTVFLQMFRWGLQNHDIVHPYFPWLAFGLPASIAIASLSYYLVERPALKLKDLVGKGRVPRGEAVAEPAPLAPSAPPA